MAEAEAAPDLAPVTGTPSLFAAIYPFIPTYTHLIITALVPIVTGAHASLCRPGNVYTPSAKSKAKAAAAPSAVGVEKKQDYAEEEEDDEEINPVETLTAKDAVLFPITAGVMLGGLYLIIKYLDDPTILSTILTYYFTVMGVFAVGKFYSDSLGVLVSVLFPRRWSEKINGVRRVYIAGHDHYKLVIPKGVNPVATDLERHNPLPRSFVPLPKALYAPIWSLRRSLLAKWTVVFKLGRGKGATTRKTFWIGDLIGLIFGVLSVALYLFSGKHWIGTNIMGVSFAYGAMQLISPATFSTATLLLSLLFFYDIYFVFYTPLMVTVATSLDVPIKLLFPRPLPAGSDKRYALAMLGLGDVVLPGIMIALSLRFDFWRWVWNCGTKDLGGVFPKTYFYSSIVGYVVGMLATLVVMHVFNHAQPALLYLVPTVLGAVWGTALVRGEIGLVWGYDEVIEIEEDEKAKKAGEALKKLAKGEAAAAKPTDAVEVKSVLVETEIDAVIKGGADVVTTAISETIIEPEPAVEEVKFSGLDALTEAVFDAATELTRELEQEQADEDIELVDEKGEAEYISVKVVKRPAPGAAVVRR
ncbi:signal peptide peptidase-domain-containing protein [Peziza echinospora]|nr:signal peptide peptidase-domain-containing protein [Peziza echinospora]